MMIRKIGLIVQREYLSKVRKKSFWVMAFLGPLLLAMAMIVPLWLGMEKDTKKTIEVVDETGLLGSKMVSTPEILFVQRTVVGEGKKTGFYATLFIPANGMEQQDEIKLYSQSIIPPAVIGYIENNLSEIIYAEKLKNAGLEKVLSSIPRPAINIKNEKVGTDWGEEHVTAARLIAGLFSCVLILFFIIIYSGQVMRGVMEEKMNRIVEVMISSVKPFELMMGKIVGIAMVSLTQFMIWLVLSTTLSAVIQSRYAKVADAFSNQNIESTLKNNPQIDTGKALEINEIITALDSLDISFMVITFLLYFILGYLLYAALFAGIGSLVDSESDTQQFVFPLIAPLLFVMFFATTIMENPHGTFAFWLSMIPFTSPLTMMLRIPFGVPVIELIISLLLLAITFLAATWLAAKVYRTGILMYGKKISPSELWRMMKDK